MGVMLGRSLLFSEVLWGRGAGDTPETMGWPLWAWGRWEGSLDGGVGVTRLDLGELGGPAGWCCCQMFFHQRGRVAIAFACDSWWELQ